MLWFFTEIQTFYLVEKTGQCDAKDLGVSMTLPHSLLGFCWLLGFFWTTKDEWFKTSFRQPQPTLALWPAYVANCSVAHLFAGNSNYHVSSPHFGLMKSVQIVVHEHEGSVALVRASPRRSSFSRHLHQGSHHGSSSHRSLSGQIVSGNKYLARARRRPYRFSFLP